MPSPIICLGDEQPGPKLVAGQAGGRADHRPHPFPRPRGAQEVLRGQGGRQEEVLLLRINGK